MMNERKVRNLTISEVIERCPVDPIELMEDIKAGCFLFFDGTDGRFTTEKELENYLQKKGLIQDG